MPLFLLYKQLPCILSTVIFGDWLGVFGILPPLNWTVLHFLFFFTLMSHCFSFLCNVHLNPTPSLPTAESLHPLAPGLQAQMYMQTTAHFILLPQQRMAARLRKCQLHGSLLAGHNTGTPKVTNQVFPHIPHIYEFHMKYCFIFLKTF